jgi:hypothetical protein
MDLGKSVCAPRKSLYSHYRLSASIAGVCVSAFGSSILFPRPSLLVIFGLCGLASGVRLRSFFCFLPGVKARLLVRNGRFLRDELFVIARLGIGSQRLSAIILSSTRDLPPSYRLSPEIFHCSLLIANCSLGATRAYCSLLTANCSFEGCLWGGGFVASPFFGLTRGLRNRVLIGLGEIF